MAHSPEQQPRPCLDYLHIAVKLSILIFPLLGALTLALTSCIWGGGALIGFGLLLLAVRPLVFKKGPEEVPPEAPPSPQISSLSTIPFQPPDLEGAGREGTLRIFLIANMSRFGIPAWRDEAFRWLKQLGLPLGVIRYPFWVEWEPSQKKFQVKASLSVHDKEKLDKETRYFEELREGLSEMNLSDPRIPRDRNDVAIDHQAFVSAVDDKPWHYI